MKNYILVVAVLVSVSAALHAQTDKQDELRQSIFFGGGSFSIDDKQIIVMNEWLDSIPDLLEKYEIQLISHTDPIGGREYNEWLSKMRSEAVEKLLHNRSIPPHKISIKDWGLENPVYRNDSFKGMIMNRRVDIILYPIVL